MVVKYYVYTPDASGVPAGRVRIRRTTLFEAVNPDASVSNTGGALWEVSESRRTFGLRPRCVELGSRNTETGVITGRVTVPVTTAARWAAISPTDTFNDAGKTYSLIRKTAEEFGE